MAMTYSSYGTTLQTMLVVQDPSGVANLNAILPNIIDYAEDTNHWRWKNRDSACLVIERDVSACNRKSHLEAPISKATY